MSTTLQNHKAFLPGILLKLFLFTMMIPALLWSAERLPVRHS